MITHGLSLRSTLQIEAVRDSLSESIESVYGATLYEMMFRHALRDMNSDPHAALLSSAQKLQMVLHAIETGRRAADEASGQSVRDLAAQLGVDIETRGGCNRIANTIVRAEYDSSGRKIVVYRESIEALAAQRWEMLDFVAAEEIHIAHELFHCIEEDRKPKRRTPKTSDVAKIVAGGVAEAVTLDLTWPPCVRIKSRFRTRTYVLRACREIAAHAFAQRLLNLEFYPGELDRN